MSSYLLPRDTWLDLCAWLMHGTLPMQTWNHSTPGAYLLDRMKYADADMLRDGVIGHWADAAAECIKLQKTVSWRAGLEEGPAAGMAICRELYKANLRSVLVAAYGWMGGSGCGVESDQTGHGTGVEGAQRPGYSPVLGLPVRRGCTAMRGADPCGNSLRGDGIPVGDCPGIAGQARRVGTTYGLKIARS